MVLLIRVFLIGLIIYLLFRSFFMYGSAEESREEKRDPGNNYKTGRKISKDVGEYIDFEEKEKLP